MPRQIQRTSKYNLRTSSLNIRTWQPFITEPDTVIDWCNKLRLRLISGTMWARFGGLEWATGFCWSKTNCKTKIHSWSQLRRKVKVTMTLPCFKLAKHLTRAGEPDQGVWGRRWRWFWWTSSEQPLDGLDDGLDGGLDGASSRPWGVHILISCSLVMLSRSLSMQCYFCNGVLITDESLNGQNSKVWKTQEKDVRLNLGIPSGSIQVRFKARKVQEKNLNRI